MCVWVVARLPQRLKSMFFEKNCFTSGFPVQEPSTRIFFQKMLILAFEVIVQQPKHNRNWNFFHGLAHCCLGNLTASPGVTTPDRLGGHASVDDKGKKFIKTKSKCIFKPLGIFFLKK